MSGNIFQTQAVGLWRPPSSVQATDARQFIRNFSFHNCKLGNQGFQRLLLQVFGYMGHGKSSFINTCKIAWDNSAYNNYTKASGSYWGDTMDRRTYQLTHNITLVDNRGCAAMKSHEKGEIFAQLANLMPLDMKVDWCRGFKLADRIVRAEPLVQPSDFISPIFIYSAGYSINPHEREELREFLETCTKITGVGVIVVLTNKTNGNVERAEAMFRDLGIKHVFSLENYTPQNQSRSMEVNNTVIQLLYEVAQNALFNVNYPRDPQKDMTRRKTFLLNYIYNKELEDHKQISEAQKALEVDQMERDMREKREEAEKQKQKDRMEHEERMKQLEAKYERQMCQNQLKHKQSMKELHRGRGRKPRK
ncbi:uncharacterized protein LOC144000377 [Lithobates pipiens]